MLTFNNKKEILKYIKDKFSKNNNIILIRGSTANKPYKNFSDIEIYGKELKKPYYEIIFLKNKPILITIYFYKYKKGKEIKPAKNIKVLHGKYNNELKPNFDKDTHSNKEKIKRECQLITDFFFKYLRSKDKKYLKSVQKRI